MKQLRNYQRFFLILGTVCALYWLFLCILYGNISFSIVFLLIGLALLTYVACECILHVCLWDKLPIMIRRILGCGIIIGALIFGGVEARILYDALVPDSTLGDSILVLGAGLHGDAISASLQYRLDKAIEVHKKNPEQLIVVSGGQGADESISEALAMKNYLVAHGIRESLILMEDRSTNTSENFRFSKELLERDEHPSYHITLITNGFHMHRATFIAEHEGFSVSRAPAKGLWTTNPCFYMREFFGVLRAYLFGF